jgi:hypothetical protein
MLRGSAFRRCGVAYSLQAPCTAPAAAKVQCMVAISGLPLLAVCEVKHDQVCCCCCCNSCQNNSGPS